MTCPTILESRRGMTCLARKASGIVELQRIEEYNGFGLRTTGIPEEPGYKLILVKHLYEITRAVPGRDVDLLIYTPEEQKSRKAEKQKSRRAEGKKVRGEEVK